MNNILEVVRGILTLNGGVLVYNDAKIGLQRFKADQVYPLSKYVLSTKISFLNGLRLGLLKSRIDILNLIGLETLTKIYKGYVIAPPLVERSDGVDVIVDGLHRFWIARQLNLPINCIYVGGASLPLIGLPVEWDRVVYRDNLPKNPRERRDLRPGIADESQVLRKYYRDLTVLGSGGRRPSGNQLN